MQDQLYIVKAHAETRKFPKKHFCRQKLSVILLSTRYNKFAFEVEGEILLTRLR